MQQTPKLAKPANVAINGFGRIGRDTLRALEEQGLLQGKFNVVAINDIKEPFKTSTYLLNNDSIFHKFKRKAVLDGNVMHLETAKSIMNIQMLAEADPQRLPWRDLDVQIVLESTGAEKLLNEEGAKMHIEAGAKKVLMSAPPKDNTKIIVLGVNDAGINFSDYDIISGASCTTNCVAPMLHVLHNEFGVLRYYANTTHAYTNDQNLTDGAHTDLPRSRAAALNIIESKTGAAKATEIVIPSLKGKGDAVCFRVPVPDGSVVDLMVSLSSQSATVDLINKAFITAASDARMADILGYSNDKNNPLVSQDIIGDPHSVVVSLYKTTKLANPGDFRLIGWYDNEWGYSNRLVKLMERMCESLQ